MNGDEVVLELEVEGQGDHYQVEARSSIGGECTATTRLVLAEMNIERNLERLRTALLGSAATFRRVLSTDEKPALRFGGELFDRLLVGDVRLLFDSTRQYATHRDLPMRLVLRIRPQELAGLPWEFMYDARRDDYLGLSMRLVRYPEMLEPVRPLRVGSPLRVLGMAARPHGHDRLDVEIERKHLSKAVEGLRNTGRIDLHWVEGETWRDLLRTLNDGPWHVLHFIGHSGFDEANGEGMLILPGDDGRNYHLRAGHLSRLLANHHPMRLVILNSCESALGDGSDAYSSTASALLRRGMPAVLAMQFAISDQAAIEFTRQFYEATASGHPLDAAVHLARIGLSFSRPSGLEWGTPVLFLRQHDGHIFDVGSAPAQLPPSLVPPKPFRQLIPPSPAATPPATPKPSDRQRPSTPSVEPEPTRDNQKRLRQSRIRTPDARVGVTALVAIAAAVALAGLTAPFWTSLLGSSSTTISVAANQDVTRTGIILNGGQLAAIRAGGEIVLEPGVMAGPDGVDGGQAGLTRIAGQARGALTARIGDGPEQVVGHDGTIRATGRGELVLGINELDVRDNTGYLDATVSVH